MRAGMPLDQFHENMATIIRGVNNTCDPVTVLTTVYYMAGYRGWPPINKGSIELTLKYNDCIRSLAAEFDCILADVWAAAECGVDWRNFAPGCAAWTWSFFCESTGRR